jgi:hypothetical protein
MTSEAANVEPVPDGRRHPPPAPPGTEGPVRVAGLRLTSQLFGGSLVLAACLLPWTNFTSSERAFGIPPVVTGPLGSETVGLVRLGFVLFLLGVAVIVAGLRVAPAVVGQAAGAAAVLVTFVFVATLQRYLGAFYAATVFGVLGIGPYVALLGGMVAAMSRGDRT